MRIRLLISILFCSTLSGQTPVGSWSDHLSYNSVNSIAVGSGSVFASTGSSIIIYNKQFSELDKMTRINGLTETGIKTIGWSEDTKTLIIAYKSSNIDLVRNNTIYNIPDIANKYISGEKEINRIRANGKYAYLACSFGIVVTDMVRIETNDTWKPGISSEKNAVNDIAFGNGKIYAATDNGIFSADPAGQGLSYFGNWDQLTSLPEPGGKYTSIIISGSDLYANLSDAAGDRIYKINGSSSLFSFVPGSFNATMESNSGGFSVSSTGSVRYFNTSGVPVRTITSYGWGVPHISDAIADNNDIWIADLNAGLVRGENMSEFSALTLPGPASNNAFNISSLNGKTVICGGGTDISWNKYNRQAEISIFEDNKWTISRPASVIDPVRSVIDPQNNEHYFVSTWGSGLLEYRNNNLIKRYTESNSPLQNIIPGQDYIKIGGMAMDRDNNLWLTQSGVQGSIKILKPDGNWIVNPMTIDVPVIGDILITSTGMKWIILPGQGLFVYDDNNTPDVFNDDKSLKLQVRDAENQVIRFVYSIAQDLDGSIWIGTDQGPLIYFSPERVFDSDLKAERIKIPRNDGTNLADYLLKSEKINSIAVDGANRKWLGTGSSGAYLLSPDGTKQIKNFNTENSPLLSNTILSLAVDNKSGDVWLGSSEGLQSYRGEATSGGETFSKVYAFPNPVREDYNGNVTITGLMRDTQIRITDVSGNLVYKTVSDGGQATWDLKNYRGSRVATGVYLVFCASKDGSQTAVTKMLVIHQITR